MSTWECKAPMSKQQTACGCLPAGFSRLRYFFGKHLSVADFIDEQRYHTTKHRLHNQRLHGAGVLCGLGLSLLDPDGTIIRVRKGAALDRCGHEVIVGFDQCIDVDAWFKKQRQQELADDPGSTWPDPLLDENGRLSVCVVLQYHECPTQPEPAPRDSCACAEGGCEFGRVSEEFLLDLYVRGEAEALTEHESFPSQEQIVEALSHGTGGVDLLRRLAEPVTESCPPGVDHPGLLLGCFNAVLSEPDHDSVLTVEDLGVYYVPPLLLSTEVIQLLLANLYVDLDVDIGAPSIVEVRWEKDDTAPGDTYRMILMLSGEINKQTVEQNDILKFRKLIDDVGWDPPPPNAMSATYGVDQDVPGPAIYVSIKQAANFLEDGALYQLYVDSTMDPIVDSELRQLRPHDFTWRFRLVDDGTGEFLMELPPFAGNH